MSLLFSGYIPRPLKYPRDHPVDRWLLVPSAVPAAEFNWLREISVSVIAKVTIFPPLRDHYK